MKRKFVTLLLALAMVIMMLPMVIMMLPMTMLSAFAAGGEGTTTTEKNITLGASHIKGAQASNIYFGNYYQSDATGQTKDPIKWRVLSNADGKLFLLADQNLDVFQYNTQYVDVTWETSTMRSWLNGYAASENGQSTDYTSDNFIKTAFSTQELAYILQTTLENANNPESGTTGGNNTTDKVFLLSIAEVTNTAYGFTADMNSTDTRVSTNTAYVAGGGKIGSSDMYSVGKADYWWLRSPGGSSDSAACVLIGSVYAAGVDVNGIHDAVRPAFNLNLSSVLFTSAAKGGKSSTAAVGGGAEFFENVDISTLTDSDGYKLTLLDANRSEFAAEVLKTSTKTFVSYSGATTGVNEYISAIIKDANGNVTYYGRLKNVTKASDASGYVEIDLSGKMNSGDKLYIFNEQYNGDYMTDYASELKEVTVPSDINAYEVSFNANGGTGTMDSAAVKSGETYTLPKCTLTPPADYCYLGWSYAANGEVINTPTITLAENVTLYAIWATQNELIAQLDKTVKELNSAVSSNDTDIETINGKINEITNLIDALDNTYATDTAVTSAIATAKSEAITAATNLVNNAKEELNAAIAKKADTETVNTAIKNLQDAIKALEYVKNDYLAADTALKAELEAEINDLKARIAELENRNPMFKVENGKLYVRYDETEEWTCIGTVQGENGADGTNGTNGTDGKDGVDGITPQIRINSETNEWEVSYDNGATWTSLGVKATGDKGEQGIQGEKGEKGDTGAAGVDGKDGADGLTIAATAIGSTALASNIALIAYALIKKKKLF